MTETSILTIVAIIVCCGILGGIANHFLPTRPRGIYGNYGLKRCVFLGIVASGVTPLFLHIVSSNLIKDAIEDPMKFLLLGSYCLLFSTFSTRVLNKVADQLLKLPLDKENEKD
ncbi:MAG: hypothetical protein KDD14_17830 [Saprospiraceae bacterium]|nr:hypothetical protein [Saprospiraceae bacterium]